MPTIFGWGIGLSDIRVTLENGTTRDCLQKVYPLGHFMLGGFAGSVRIGFAMIDALSALLGVAPPDQAWDPLEVANWLPADLRNIFSGFPESDQDHQLHFMTIAAHPTQNAGDAPWARTYGHIFRSPYFEPVTVGRIDSIGSGATIDPCKAEIEKLLADDDLMFSLMQLMTLGAGAAAQALALDISKLLENVKPNGISPHLHIGVVSRGLGAIFANDRTEFGSDGPIEFKMPPVARSWSELVAMLEADGESAAGCLA